MAKVKDTADKVANPPDIADIAHYLCFACNSVTDLGDKQGNLFSNQS